MYKNILKKNIPDTGYGRKLTSSECVALRKHKVSCSPAMRVLRYGNSPTTGRLYRKVSGSRSMTSTSIIVSD